MDAYAKFILCSLTYIHDNGHIVLHIDMNI